MRCLSVGFLYMFVSSDRFLLMVMCRSKKCASVVDVSNVNLMVGWNKLANCVNWSKDDGSPSQMMKMSSMNRFQSLMWWLWFSVSIVSISVMKMLA